MDNKELDFNELEQIVGGEGLTDMNTDYYKNFMSKVKKAGYTLEQVIALAKNPDPEIVEYLKSIWDQL